MPTGYTAKIEDGTIVEVKDYILQCARAFGALIHMREESMDKEIEYCVPNEYYKEKLEESKRRLDDFMSLTDKEIQVKIEHNYKTDIESNKEIYKGGEESNKKYNEMLEKVKSWIPPTNEHLELKEFAINQIEISKSDWHIKYKDKMPERLSVNEYKKLEIDGLNRDIEYNKKRYQEEIKRCEERNKWIRELIESFK